MANKKTRILIVEDDPKWQKSIMRCELLANIQGSDPDSIIVVSSYDAAKNQLDLYDFDLAITDVILEEDGIEYDWRSIAHLLQRKQIPIVVVSGYLGLDLAMEMVNDYGVMGIFDKASLDQRKLQKCLERILIKFERSFSKPERQGMITWLHLSDLHFNSSSKQHNREIVMNAFFNDLEICKENEIHSDFIVVTGDIAFSGLSNEYQKASEFFDRLLESTQVPKNRLFIIPGNHDVNRNKITSITRSIKMLQTRDSVLEILEDNNSRSLFISKFDEFNTFIQDYFKDTDDSIFFDANNYYFAKMFEVHGKRVAILGLNSAWNSGTVENQGEVIDKGNLIVGEKPVVDGMKKIRTAHIKLAIMHHPLSYLRDFDGQDILTELNRNCNFLLHGHLHVSDAEFSASSKGNIIIIPAGALYQRRDLVNSYNFVQVDSENSVARIIFRRYSDNRREWLKDLDATGEIADGELVMEINSHK